MKISYKFWIIFILSALIVLTITAQLISPNEYSSSIITELVGVLITVIIVDWLYGLDQSRKEKLKEYQKILNANNIISIYFEEYKNSIIEMCSIVGEPLITLDTLTINDLQYMYEQSFCHRLKPFFEKNIFFILKA